MAYKVSGSTQEPITITVLNTDGVAQATEYFRAGAWEIDSLACASGTIVGFTDSDREASFGNVSFIEYDYRPSVPWTDTLSGSLNPNYWRTTGTPTMAFSMGNSTRMTTNSSYPHNNFRSKFYIQGNFDVELAYDIVARTDVNSWEVILSAVFACSIYGGTNELQAHLYRLYNSGAGGNIYNFTGYSPNVFAYPVATSHSTGKLRLVRSGSIITPYYWNGSSWTSFNSVDFGAAVAGWPVYFIIGQNSWTNQPHVIVDYSYFKVNSGTIQYTFEENNVGVPNYAEPNNDIYTALNPYPKPYIYNNKIRFDIDYSKKTTGQPNPTITSLIREQLVGDFDVSTDLNIVIGPASYTWQFKIQVQNPAANYIATVGRWYSGSGHVFNTETVLNGVYNGYNATSTETLVSLRIKRIGATVYTYYKTQGAASWTLHRTITGFSTEALYLILVGINSDNVLYGYSMADFSNLVINNSGNINTKMLINIPSYFTNNNFEQYTNLLLHFDEATLVDSSRNKYVVTANGGISRSATQSKFGGYSLAFDGVNDYIVLPNSIDWYYGSNPFTWDFWVRFSNNSTRYILISNRNPTGPVTTAFEFDGTVDKFFFQQYSSGATKLRFSCNFTPNNTTWYHVALVRVNSDDSASGWRIFIDGISQTLTKTDGVWNWSFPNVNSNLYIGSLDGSQVMFGGYMDELRISKGIARWTENFTPPTSAYSA
jgi:hypothetical protein